MLRGIDGLVYKTLAPGMGYCGILDDGMLLVGVSKGELVVHHSRSLLDSVSNEPLVGSVGDALAGVPVGDQELWLTSHCAEALDDRWASLVVSVASLGGWVPRFCYVVGFRRRPLVVWVGIQVAAGHKVVGSSPWVVPLLVVPVFAAFADSLPRCDRADCSSNRLGWLWSLTSGPFPFLVP